MGGRRGGASRPLPLETRKLSSRHIVTSAARPLVWELSLPGCGRWGFGVILRSIRVHFHAKSASSATSQKVMSFVFSHFLASFPLFSISRRLSRTPRGGSTSQPADSHRHDMHPHAKARSLAKSAHLAIISSSFLVRFALQENVTSFVFNDFLASFPRFLCFVQARVFLNGGLCPDSARTKRRQVLVCDKSSASRPP